MVPDLDPDKPDPDPVWPDLDPAISGSGSGLPGSRSGNIRIWIWLLPDPRIPMDYPVRFRLYCHQSTIPVTSYLALPFLRIQKFRKLITWEVTLVFVS